MKKKWWMGMGLAIGMFGASPAMAQVAAPAPAAAADAAKPGFLKRCCEAIDECRRKMCKAPCGQMLNSMTMPLSTMTGGVIPSFCPGMPSAKDLAQPGVAGAADNAKKDALEAKARRDSVKYLGTLDCRYYPEAEAALIAALRTDRVECVRWEAAMAFANGCCCTKKVMAALEICVSGSDKDGNPAERSDRVRDYAFIALNKCISCYREPVPEEEEKKEIKERPPTEKFEKLPKERKENGDKKDGGITNNDKNLLERSRRTVALYQAHREGSSAQSTNAQSTVLQKGQRSLYHIIRYGADGAPTQQPAMQPVSRTNTQPPPVVGPPPRELPQIKANPAGEPRPLAVTVPAKEDSSNTAPVQPVSVPANSVQPMAQSVISEKPPVQPIEQPMAQPVVSEKPPVQPIEAEVKPDPRPVDAATLTNNEVKQPASAVIEKPQVSDLTITGLIDNLLTGTTPSDRHQAIRGLATHDWRKHPQIVAGLVKTARLDSDRAVRVNAIRHLAALKMDLPYVGDHLKFMLKDQDEWVRQESQMSLEKLQASK